MTAARVRRREKVAAAEPRASPLRFGSWLRVHTEDGDALPLPGERRWVGFPSASDRLEGYAANVTANRRPRAEAMGGRD